MKTSSLSGAVNVPAVEAWEWLLCCVSAATRAAGPWPLAAGFAALRPHVGQVAAAEQAEGLAETERQPVAETVCTCVCVKTERQRERQKGKAQDTVISLKYSCCFG